MKKRPHEPRPQLTAAQILAWADSHLARTGAWPNEDSGPVPGTRGETWGNVNAALALGLRGRPGGDSLARLLARRVGVRNRASVPPLTEEKILGWADEYHRRTGRWPRVAPDPVEGAPGETWRLLDHALRDGLCGLPGGSSLLRLLAEYRGARNKSPLPRLTLRQIREWGDAHRRRTGRWPGPDSGPVAEAPGETWRAVYMALYRGLRGLPGGLTLRQLLGGDARRGEEP